MTESVSVSTLLLVGTGGFLGSTLRFLASTTIGRAFPQFPLGTLTVNVIGCLLIGLIAGLADHREMLGPAPRAFLVAGLLGGFTTFSAFGQECCLLLRQGDLTKAAASVVLNVGLGLLAASLGHVLATR